MYNRHMTEASTAKLRANLAEYLHLVSVQGETVYVTSNGRRVAALVPLS